jgi:hypothetical protein
MMFPWFIATRIVPTISATIVERLSIGAYPRAQRQHLGERPPSGIRISYLVSIGRQQRAQRSGAPETVTASLIIVSLKALRTVL